jgi:cell division protein ZapE
VSVRARLSGEVAAHRLEFDAAQAHAADRLDEVAANFRRRSEAMFPGWRARIPWLAAGAARDAPKGLYLWGGVGRGKTLLMNAFADSLDGLPVQRSHFYHFLRRVHAELGSIKERERPLDAVAHRIAHRVRLICLDEFFVSDIADAMILAGLFEGLFRRGVMLVATSNVAPQDLYKDGLQRQRFLPAIALVESRVEVLRLDSGTDYRLRQLARAPTYFDARQSQTPEALKQRFTALAGAAAGGPTTLTIEGRPLHVVATGPDMAWFEFSELCEGPRSQNDYIELARLYGTLFIANIPIFTPQLENAARRFIMLIDELYDRGVKIVVSAAGAPAELYQGERLGFEFERAASRLVDMQTQQYLAGQHHA